MKNAEIEEGTIGGDCRDGGMNKQGGENCNFALKIVLLLSVLSNF